MASSVTGCSTDLLNPPLYNPHVLVPLHRHQLRNVAPPVRESLNILQRSERQPLLHVSHELRSDSKLWVLQRFPIERAHLDIVDQAALVVSSLDDAEVSSQSSRCDEELDSLRHNPNLLLHQPVQLVHQPINLPVRSLD